MLASFSGQAARHMNCVGDDYILTVNSEYRTEVFQRGVDASVKTLDISYMRASRQVGNFLFIGTEEKMIYLVDITSFEILDSLPT